MQTIYESILKIDILAPPSQYVGALLQALCDHLHYVAGVVLERDAVGLWQTFASYHSQHDGIWPETIGLKSMAQFPEELYGNEIRILTDLVPDDRLACMQTFCQDCDIRTVVVVPLLSYGRPSGVCLLFDARDRSLTDAELGVLGKVGEMASIAILSNRYLSQLHQRTKELHEEIAERQRIEEALRNALRRRRELEEIVNRSPVVVVLLQAAPGWPVEFVSRSVEQLGYTADDLTEGAVPFFALLHPEDAARIEEEVTRQIQVGAKEFVLEYRVVTRSGEERWVENHMWTRRDADCLDLLHVVLPAKGIITHVQGIIQDITERKRAEEMIRRQAYHDPLTDLPNRALFFDRLTTALSHARRTKRMLAVMFLDLDRFKAVNDTLGHAMGDLLLQSVAQRLCERLREEDTVSRLGGDEFTILLPEIARPEDAGQVAQKILLALETPFNLNGKDVTLSTSIGISLFPDDGPDAQTILNCADRALYCVKEQGRNAYRFFSNTAVEAFS